MISKQAWIQKLQSYVMDTEQLMGISNKQWTTKVEAALSLWEMTWEQFIAMPSKLTAEPMIREERETFLHQVTKNGFIDNYSGIRISSSGRKFKIMNAVVWNLVDTEGIYRGQAAAFEQYEYLT